MIEALTDEEIQESNDIYLKGDKATKEESKRLIELVVKYRLYQNYVNLVHLLHPREDQKIIRDFLLK